MDAPRTASNSTEELERKLRRLPMLPAVVGELIALDGDSDDYTARVGEIAERDPALAGRLLGVANGAVLAPANPITTLNDALVRLGARRVATLVSSFAVASLFVPTTQAQRDLWKHSSQTAVAAQEIAARCGWEVTPQMAYVAGLLHDLGRFVLHDKDAISMPREDVAEWNAPQSLVAAERARIGIDHAGVGFMAARVWQLPRALAEVIRFHHHHGPLGDKISAEGKRLLRIVQQADSLSHLLMRHADELDRMSEAELEHELAARCICPTWGDVPVEAEALADLLPFAQERSQELIEVLGVGAS